MAVTKTAIVVGAGITGVAAAEHLRRDGWRVTLVDRVPPGDPAQASYGNAGLLARSSIVPVAVPGLLLRAPRLLLDPDQPLFLRWRHLPRLVPWLVPFLRSGRADRATAIAAAIHALTHDTLDAHRGLAEGTEAARFLRFGDYAYLFADRAAFRAAAFAFGLKAAHGHAWREVEGPDLRAIDPALGPAAGFAAIFPDHGWITAPGPYVAALARHFHEQGGTVRRAEVRAVRPTGTGADVVLDGETLAADRVVLAAGIGSRRLAETLGLRVPLETERGYHVFLRGANHVPPFPMMLSDKAFVMTPMEGGLRCAGLVEFGGTEAGPSPGPIALIRRALGRVYPGLVWEGEETWMGHRPTTIDSLPMLGPVPGAPSVLCAFGSQHLGLTIGPRLGRLVASLAQDRTPNEDLTAYAAGRFGGGPRGV